MDTYRSRIFTEEELNKIRGQFYYVDEDHYGRKRLFFDNAGGSLRLKKAEEVFHLIDSMPDASEHSNSIARELAALEDRGREDIKKVIFGAKSGTIYPSYTASQIAMEMVRVITENARGTNIVTTMLEHPSVFDAARLYSRIHGMELRVAGVNKETGGVDADTILSLIDQNTALLCCMAASNISGYIYETEKICRRAREINPDIYIYIDAVQHAPHGVLAPEEWGADVTSFAPYKFFGVRGFGLAYLSDRVSRFVHHRLLGKPEDDWEIGSPATAQFAVITEIINYVAGLGGAVCHEGGTASSEGGTASSGCEAAFLLGKTAPPEGGTACPEEQSRRKLFEIGMQRIADHERGLLDMMLEGVDGIPGLRHIPGVTVQMDGKDLTTRDLILGIEFENLSCEQAVVEYEKRGVITFERALSSMYSKRMVEAFDSKGMVRLSPLHVNTPQEIRHFLVLTQEMAGL